MHYYMEAALTSIPVSLEEKCREIKLYLKFGKPNY
jgi:hypothetical protein